MTTGLGECMHVTSARISRGIRGASAQAVGKQLESTRFLTLVGYRVLSYQGIDLHRINIFLEDHSIVEVRLLLDV